MVADLVTGGSVWQRRRVLRVAGARLLDDRDRGGVRVALDEDPVAACMVAARVEVAGLDPWRLGGELWSAGSHLSGLCFSGANLVPIRGDRAALRQFADPARRAQLLVDRRARRAGAADVGHAGRALGAVPRGARRPAPDGAGGPACGRARSAGAPGAPGRAGALPPRGHRDV